MITKCHVLIGDNQPNDLPDMMSPAASDRRYRSSNNWPKMPLPTALGRILVPQRFIYTTPIGVGILFVIVRLREIQSLHVADVLC